MKSLALARARARTRLHPLHSGDDTGFMLIYVLAITTIIAILVGGTLVVTTSAVVPAVKSAYAQAADSAAQGGLQAFVAYVDDKCPSATASVADCTLPSNYSGVVEIPIPNASSGYTATYSWLAAKDPTNRYFRVKSTGVVKQNGISATKVVVGDVVGGASMDDLDYGVITGFETQSSATVLSDNPARTIALDCTAVDAADVPIKGDNCASNSAYLNSINWSGASPGTAAGKVAVCNATFDAKGGRGNNPPPKAPNPYVDWTESGLNGNNYDNYQPCHTTWGTKTWLMAPANTDNGNGGYYSNDSVLLSNSYPGGSGPRFDQPVSTGWHYTSDDTGICSTVSGQNYRSFNLLCAGYPVEVGGAPASNSKFPNVQVGQGPQVPSGLDPVIPAGACVYAGPTRIALNGDSAVVTSPQTTSTWVAANASSRPVQCYTGAGLSGMSAQTVNLTGIQVVRVANNGDVPTTTPATAHGSSGWPTTGQKLGDSASTANSVFYLTNGTSGTTSSSSTTVTATPGSYVPATGDNPSSKSDGAWTPQWTSFSTGTTCSTSTTTTDLKFFNCYQSGGTYSASAYSTLKTTVTNALAGAPTSYDTAAELQAYLTSVLSAGNSSDAASSAPTYTDNRSHRWKVSVASGSAGSCTQSTGVAGTTTDTTLNAPSTDTFYENTAGNVHTAPATDTSCLTATVTLQIGTCNVALVLGVCVNLGNYVWGNGTALLGGGQSIAQFKTTSTVKATTTTSTTVAGTSTFPYMADVSQYQIGFDNTGNANDSRDTFGANGPGDLFVEGNVGHTMALVADDDVVVTGSTGPTGTNPSSPSTTDPNADTSGGDNASAALELVGRNNVRVYHPVKCKITSATAITATDPGFCPNDITGLYDSVLPNGTWPYQQYVNMRTDLAGLTIHAAVFALGNSSAHITCPEPPDGGGVCGGEFTTDNYNRGTSLGYVTVIGTLAMAHHAPVGQEWQVSDQTGQTSRPYSGYQLAQQYRNNKALFALAPDVANVLHTRSVTSSLWHILSISTGTPS
jgi:hypothetical protein